MTWTTPKTDWQGSTDGNGNYTGDYFNVADYNRIKNNMLYIYDKAGLEIDLGDDMVCTESQIDNPTAAQFNAIEEAIEKLRTSVKDLDTGTMREYFQNGRCPTYTDLNRIEEAEQKYYDYFGGE